MADNIGNKAAHDYHLDVPVAQEGFYVKGNTHCDWGMKNRLSRMFDPKSGNTVMLAFDHGYIMGPTAGLERIDLVIPPLIPYVDVLMGTRGVIHSCISPTAQVGKCVRVTYDSTVLFDDMSNGAAGPHRRRRYQVRHPHPGRRGCRQGHGAHREVLPVGHPCAGGERR